MIVIDIGCARYGGDYSIERLIEEFQPDTLYGFDPNPAIIGMADALLDAETPCRVIELRQAAAWLCDGEIGYREDGLNSWLTKLPRTPQVPCFDLAAFIVGLNERDVVLKIDAEGSEYELLDHLIATGVDAQLALAIVEWHDFGVATPEYARASIERKIRCPLREWTH